MVHPTEGFTLQLKIGVLAGLFLASPVIMAEIWLFVAPGLYSHEKKFAIPFVFLTTIFFVAGAAFSHYVVFPLAWQFFMSFQTEYVRYMPSIGETFSLYVKMLLALGVVFELPTVVFFLARMGVITARFMIRYTKHAILAIFIIAAVITPSADVVTQTLVAGPMFGLYVLSIGIAWAFGRKKVST
jgi:sec-independent protein translocase protein TatC